MDTLDNTEYEVVIVGTGLQQSLLALALSRSDKKILHIDENPYYGGSATAFSIPAAEEWVAKVNEGFFHAAFAEASIHESESSDSTTPTPSKRPGREYNLALAPDILYSNSAFRRYLVTSQVHHQIGFLPVSSWWVYSPDGTNGGGLERVPNTREDLLGHALSFPARRALLRILRFMGGYETDDEKGKWEQYRNLPFSEFLTRVFKAPAILFAPLLALTMSTKSPENVSTEYALPRLARHLRSTGELGKFSALIPKYGGLDEFCQTACRACAVGGGVYVLGKGLSTSEGTVSSAQIPMESLAPIGLDSTGEGKSGSGEGSIDKTSAAGSEQVSGVKLHLNDGEAIAARWVVSENSTEQREDSLCRSISIISSPLATLFSPVIVQERSIQPGAAILVFPTGSLSLPEGTNEDQSLPPVHVHVHSSETGECPVGQSVLYASTSLPGKKGFQLLKQAISRLLASVGASLPPEVLWSMQYEQRTVPSTAPLPSLPDDAKSHFLGLPPTPLDLAVDDVVFDRVRTIWQTITDEDPKQFLMFKNRESQDDDEDI